MNRYKFDKIWNRLGINYEIWDGDDFIEENESYNKDCIYTLAPYHLGFVNCDLYVELTSAGRELLKSRKKDEVFLRQLLKFQIPSPYHKPSDKAAKFCIKPYLEILRLIRTLGTLKFDELQIFGAQMTDYHKFDDIVKKIEEFRFNKAKHNESNNNDMYYYADACFRYLRATGLVAISHVGKSLSIIPERIDDVDYILNNISREPIYKRY